MTSLRIHTLHCSPLPSDPAHLDRNIAALQAAVVHNRMGSFSQHHQPAVPVRHKLRGTLKISGR